MFSYPSLSVIRRLLGTKYILQQGSTHTARVTESLTILRWPPRCHDVSLGLHEEAEEIK